MFTRIVRTVAAALLLTLPSLAQSHVRPLPTLAKLPQVRPRANPFEILEPGRETPPTNTFAGMDFYGAGYDTAQFKGQAGTVATQRGAWNGILGSRRDDGGLFAVQLRSEFSFYDFAGAPLGLGSGNPLNDVYESAVGISSYFPTTEQLGYFAGIEVTAAGEDAASFGRSLSFGGLGGVRYQANKDLSLSLGLGGQSRFEDQAFVIPYLGFDWRVTNWLHASADGSIARLTFRLARSLNLDFTGGFEMRQYRLNSGNVLQDDNVYFSTGLLWMPSATSRVRLSVGTNVWREFNVLAPGGQKLAQVEVDNAPFVTLGVTFNF